MMHEIYLPFSEETFRRHFAQTYSGKVPQDNSVKHLEYYRRSIERYRRYISESGVENSSSLSEVKLPCQIEKDERFWTAACWMSIYYSKSRREDLTRLFQRAFGDIPPLGNKTTWEECLTGDLYLFFESNLPSPKTYRKWLQENLEHRHLIPNVLKSNNGKKNLEGPTNVDALLLNETNGFAMIVEAKVLSDISCQITYDVMRNQIARNVDVMLEKNPGLCPPLNRRDPDKSLFMLLTPRVFQKNPESRFYGYKFQKYREQPNSLANDLPHRLDSDWNNISERLGWLTWEDFREINPDCCNWIGKHLEVKGLSIKK
ncbi:MAG: hypothetical protein JXL20_03870 [Deltaproteobacteria bacterium]|nr:hypothetical protein [Deltaproteobacteria bacterium]